MGHILVILGMHRSGTSAFTGALQLLGVDLGKNLMAANEYNVKGYFENDKIVNLNERIIHEFNHSWDTQFPLPEKWENEKFLDNYKKEAVDIINEEFAISKNCTLAIKDPRIGLLLPFWQAVFEIMLLDAKYIVLLRKPEEIAESLEKREHFTKEKVSVLFLNHIFSIENHTRKYNRVFVPFDEFLKNPKGILNHVSKKLDFKYPKNISTVLNSIEFFLDPKLKHFNIKSDKISSLPSIVKDVYNTVERFWSNSISSKEIVKTINKQREQYNSSTSLFYNNDTINESIDSLKKLEGLGTEVNTVNELLEQHKKEKEEDKNLIEKLNSELKTFNNELQNKEHSSVQTQKELNKLETEIVELTNKLNTAANEKNKNDKAKQDIETLKLKNSEKEKEFKQLEKEFHEIKGKYNFINDKLEQKEQQIQKLQIEKEKEHTSIAELRLTIEQLLNEQNLSKNELSKLESKFADTELKYSERKESDRKQIEILKKHAESFETIEKELKDTIHSLEWNSALLKQNEFVINNLKSELKSEAEQSNHVIAELRRELNEIREEKLAIKSSLSTRIGWMITAPFRWVYNLFSKDLPFFNSKFWLYTQLFFAALLSPLALFAKIDKRNIAVLKHAIKTEPPSQILRNFKKLLRGGNYEPQQESIDKHKSESEILDKTVAFSNSENEKFKVLYISPHLPDFDSSSGGKRALRQLALLAEECEVYTFTLGEKPKKHIDELKKHGINVFLSSSFNEVHNLLPKVDAIVFAWWYSYFDCIQFTSFYPDAVIINDTVDVHWVREERSIGVWDGATKESVAANKKREIAAYKAADIVWVVTENDRQQVLKELPKANIRVVSNIHEPVISDFVPCTKNTILFFGGYQHYPNISATKILAEEIFPIIKAEIPNAKLIIAGSKAPDEVKKLGDLEGVEFKGFIEENEVEKLYRNTKLTIIPLLAGAGIKGKICEAIAYMKPIITNAIGNEGIHLKHEEEGFVTEDFNEMAQLAIRVMKGEYDLEKITSNALDKLDGIVGPSIAKRNMMDSVIREVSICIVTWNRLELLRDCLDSVIKETIYPNYKVLVHSNGCEDGTQEYLAELANTEKRIVPILSKDNEVFVRPNNNMMLMYPHNDAVLLNNDTLVTKGWLMGLYRASHSSNSIGIAGSKILYPDGTLQEFGSELYADSTGRNIGKWDDPKKPEFNVMTKAGYVSGCSMYITNRTIKTIGVFDEQFHPCYCEDSDYCYTAWEHDIETVVTPESIIYHFEGGTSGTDTSSGFKSYQVINMKKFMEKHKGKKNGIDWGIPLIEINSDNILSESFKSLKEKYNDSFGIELLTNTQLEDTEADKITLNKIESYHDFLEYKEKMKNIYDKRHDIENKLFFNQKASFDLWGFNFMVNELVPYRIELEQDNATGHKIRPNYRESLLCPVTNTNSRIRATAAIIEGIIKGKEKELDVYFTEQISKFFNYYDTKLEKLIGSECLNDELTGGIFNNGIRYETITNLSFNDNHFDLIVSLEIFQHIPDYQVGLKEMYRCLKPNGTLVLTVPFIIENEKTIVRSQVKNNGEIEHLQPEIYYPNISKPGENILCYYHYGWDLLEDLKAAGFKNIQANFTWSLYYGILGTDCFVFTAEKKLID